MGGRCRMRVGTNRGGAPCKEQPQTRQIWSGPLWHFLSTSSMHALRVPFSVHTCRTVPAGAAALRGYRSLGVRAPGRTSDPWH